MNVWIFSLALISFVAMADNPPATLWSNNYTISGSLTWCVALVPLDEGKFIISGPFLTGSGDMDSYLLAVNSDGSENWHKTIGKSAGCYEFVFDLIQAANGDFVQAGYAYWGEDVTALIIRTNSIGDSLSYRTYSEGTLVTSIQELSNGNFIASGRLEAVGEWFGWLTEIDENESILWSKYYGPPGIETNLSDFVVLGDNSIIACGSSGEYRYLQRTDSDGETLWTQTDLSSSGSFASIEALPEGGFILAGYDYEGVPESRTAYLSCIDEMGVVEWDGNYSGKYEWSASDVKRCLDGGFLVCGSKSSDPGSSWGLVFRTDSNGELVWEYGYGEIGDTFLSCAVLPSDGYCVAGIATSPNPDAAWLLRLDIETGVENQDFSDETSDIMTVLSSNPLRGELLVNVDIPVCTRTQLVLYDISGRFVCSAADEVLHPGTHNFTIPTESLSKGVYLIRVDAGELTETETVIILN